MGVKDGKYYGGSLKTPILRGEEFTKESNI